MANSETDARPAHRRSAQGSDLGLSPAERSSVPLALSRAALASDDAQTSAQDSTATQPIGGFGQMPAWEASNALQAKDIFFSLAALATSRTNRADHSTGGDNSLVGAVRHSAPASAGQLVRDSSGLTEPRSVAARTSGGLNPAIPAHSRSDKMVESPGGPVAGPLECGGSWSGAGLMARETSNHTANLLSNGKVLVAGGVDLDVAQMYDPTTGGWGGTGNMSGNRGGHQSVLLDGGEVMVIGGGTYTTERYNPTTGTWMISASMSVGRAEHRATLLNNNMVLVAGGWRGFGDPTTYSSAELYDPDSNAWTTTGSMSVPRRSHTLVLLDNGLVLAAGGGGLFGGGTSTAELYDPSLGTWSTTGSMSEGRFGHQAVKLGDGRVLVVGGGYASASTAELYDPDLGTWSTTGSMSHSRVDFTLTHLSDGRVLAAGGILPMDPERGGPMDPTAEIYDPATGSWCLTASMGTGRGLHTATLLDTGQVLVSGGIYFCDPSFGCGATPTAELFSP